MLSAVDLWVKYFFSTHKKTLKASRSSLYLKKKAIHFVHSYIFRNGKLACYNY